MRCRRLLAIATAAAILAFSSTMAAAADPTDQTTATLTVTGGTLDITVDPTRRSLGKAVSTANKKSILSGLLGEVVVTDGRGAPRGSGWIANVTSTPFTTTGGPAIPASQVAYTTGRIAKQGTATYTSNNPNHLQRPTPAVTATDITGNNTATWAPTIHVTIPADQTAGTYTATITHSVL